MGAVVIFLLLLASALHKQNASEEAIQAAIVPESCPEYGSPEDFKTLCPMELAVIE